jgi:hypothetical protein
VLFIKYYYGDQMRENEMTGQVARMGEMKNASSILVGKPEGKRPFERPRRRWKNNTRTDLMEIGWEGVD